MFIPSILACTTCARAFHSAGGNAAGLAILLLLVVIVGVLSGVVFLMVRIARREQENLPLEYRDEVSSSHSI